ncbi:MAG TPA: zinc-ribbon domain-containing protein [Myxococcota bacterium]|nr:zinc-ribbon domain-containing protein [Myxococcota bacterium]
MIAACPQCQTRYRLAREKIGPQGARIRCSQCQTIFRVQSPDGAAQAEAPPSAVAGPAPARAPAPKLEPRPAPAVAPPAPPPAPRVLPPLGRAIVAELDADNAKAVTELLAQWRIEADVVDDGGEALVRMFRSPPLLAILGGDLPSLSAARVAELAQRATELAAVKLIRIATTSDQTGTPGFDAEEMLEAADYPGGLAEILGRLGIGAKPSHQAPAAVAPVAKPKPAPAAPAAPQPPKPMAPAPAPRAAAPRVPSSDPAIAAAERLARIAVSDVILYNQEKFAAAAARGTAAKEMASELGEARQHFNSRVAPVVRADRDFLVEELERRAAVLKGA